MSNDTFASASIKRQEQRDDGKRKECIWEKVATPLEYILLRYNSSTATPLLTTIPKLRPKFPCENFGSNCCINIIKILFRTTFPSVAQENPFFLFFNRKTYSRNPPRPAGRYILHLISYFRLTTRYSERRLFVTRRVGLPVQANWQCDPQTRIVFSIPTNCYTTACLYVWVVCANKWCIRRLLAGSVEMSGVIEQCKTIPDGAKSGDVWMSSILSHTGNYMYHEL